MTRCIEKFIIEKRTSIKRIIIASYYKKEVCTLMGLHREDNIITFVEDACDRIIF